MMHFLMRINDRFRYNRTMTASMESLIERAAGDLVAGSHAICLTGAGMSTESGIPDFRGPDGLWTKHPELEQQAYRIYDVFLQDPARYWELRMEQNRLYGDVEAAPPNPGHYALAELEQMGIVKCLITQNIDGLHAKAGSRHLLEYHGSLFKLRCPSCGSRYRKDAYPLDDLMKNRDLPPRCRKCNGALKFDVVHFNESIPEDVTAESMEQAARCDAMLVCGTSAVVYPFAMLPRIAGRSSGNGPAVIIEINAVATVLTSEGVSDYIIAGKTSQVLPAIVRRIKELKR